MKIKCIAIDDNITSISIVKELINEVKDFELIETFSNPIEAINFLKRETKVDLIFLDYEMPQMTGIDFLRTVMPSQPIIFISKHPSKAVESFEVRNDIGIEVVSFLEFPPKKDSFLKACEKARSFVLEKNKFLTLRENRMDFRFDLEEIVGVSTDKDDPKYLKLFILDASNRSKVKEHETPFRITIAQMMTKLPSDKFVQIHRATIINIKQIVKYGTDEIFLTDNKKFTLGGSFRADFEKVLRRI
jgi:two-component system LytT family response regulator